MRIGLIVLCCLSAYAEARRIKFEWSTTSGLGWVHSSKGINDAELKCIRRVEWVERAGRTMNRRYSVELEVAELGDKAAIEWDIRACLSGGNQ